MRWERTQLSHHLRTYPSLSFRTHQGILPPVSEGVIRASSPIQRVTFGKFTEQRSTITNQEGRTIQLRQSSFLSRNTGICSDRSFIPNEQCFNHFKWCRIERQENNIKKAAYGNLLLVSISNLHFGESKPFKRILEMTHEFHNPNTSSLLSHWLIEFWRRNRNSLIFCFSSDFRLSLFGQTNCPLMLRVTPCLSSGRVVFCATCTTSSR